MSTYELTIDGDKEKIVVDFLNQLDFVKIKKVSNRKTRTVRPNNPEPNTDLPYFGIAPDWAYPKRNPRQL